MPTGTQSTILIAATHRSGSYLVCDWLSQLGDIPFAEEYFNFNLLAARQELRLSNEFSQLEVLNQLIAQKQSEHGVFVVKSMWAAFESLFTEILLASQQGAQGGDVFDLAFDLLGKPKVLFARRRNKVKQAVSFEKAKQQDVWRSEKYDPSLEATLVYSYPRLFDCWNQVHQNEEEWLTFLQKYDLPYYEIWYEDMVADPQGVVGGALRFLGREINPDVVIQSRFEKLSSGLNADWAARFTARQVARANVDSVQPSTNVEVLAEMRCLQDPVILAPDSKCIVECELVNQGVHVWQPKELSSGATDYVVELWRLDATGQITGECLWRTELESAIAPGESAVLQLRLVLGVSEGVAGGNAAYTFLLCHPGGEVRGQYGFDVKVELDAKWQYLRSVFVELVDSDMTGWVKVPGWGDLWPDSFPFLYHNEHGWLNVDREHSLPGVMFAHDFKLGYFSLDLSEPSVFNIIKGEQRQVLRFQGVVNGQRIFVDEESGEMLKCPLSQNDEE